MRVAMAIIGLLSLLLVSTATAEEKTPAAKKYQELLEQFQQEGNPRAFAPKFIALAEEHADDPSAASALIWVIQNVPGRSDTSRALVLLQKDHLESEELSSACRAIARSRSVAAEPLLRSILDRSPHAEVRAKACYWLAQLLDGEANIVEQLARQPDLAPRTLQYYGSEYGKHLSLLEAAQLAQERQQVYKRMRESFADATVEGEKLGELAKKALFAIRHLSIGSTAPEIEGEDIHGERFRLSDYRGKVVMLSFWGHW